MDWINVVIEIVIFAGGILEICKFLKKWKAGIMLRFYDKLSLIIGIIYIVLGVYFLTPLSDSQDVLTIVLGILLVLSIILQYIWENKHPDQN